MASQNGISVIIVVRILLRMWVLQDDAEWVNDWRTYLIKKFHHQQSVDESSDHHHHADAATNPWHYIYKVM